MPQPAKTNTDFRNILTNISYRDWDIVFRDERAIPYLQIQFDAPDSFTGVVERQHCRKWMLSRFMTDSEIVRTAYKAIEAAIIHEMQEDFRFHGESVYRPHVDIYALLELSTENRIDKRE